MLHLFKPAASDLSNYFKSIEDKLTNSIAASGLIQLAKNFLTPIKLREIIIDEPEKLIVYHNDFMIVAIPGFDATEYKSFHDNKGKDYNSLPAQDQGIRVKYKPTIDALEGIFDYKEIISNSKSKSYNLALRLNRNTCTYCNRLYTNTVQYKDPVTKRVNNGTRITRPQFDHWFAKSIYPLLGLSYYNLIPSCSVCNSSIKGDDIFSLDTHIHPYLDYPKELFVFSYNQKDLKEANVKIITVPGSKMQTHLDAFKIQQVYDAHSNLELQDLLDLRYKYSENYLNTLLNKTFKNLGLTRSEIIRMVFGVEENVNEYHKRPFSKFKNDIVKELERNS